MQYVCHHQPAYYGDQECLCERVFAYLCVFVCIRAHAHMISEVMMQVTRTGTMLMEFERRKVLHSSI